MINTLSQNVIALSEQERARLFRMLTDHADVLRKVLPGLSILEGIHSNNLIDTNDPVVQLYMIWKNAQ
jgi:hypothetical protein